MALGKVICVPDPAEAAARDEAMGARVGDEPAPAPGLPDIDTGFIHPSAPHAGKQLVQGKVGARPFDDVHGVGWRLITVDVDGPRIDRGLRTWFASIGGRIVALTDPDPTYARWFSGHDTTCALQRPDFYLYGTATTAAGASALLDDLRRHLAQGALT